MFCWGFAKLSSYQLAEDLCMEHSRSFLLCHVLVCRILHKCCSCNECWYRVLFFDNLMHCIFETNFVVIEEWSKITFLSTFLFSAFLKKINQRKDVARSDFWRSKGVKRIALKIYLPFSLFERLMVRVEYMCCRKGNKMQPLTLDVA